MTWRPAIDKATGEATTYARQWKRYTCAKKYIDGCTLYQLYAGDEIIGHYNDFADAKTKAEELEASK